MSRRVEHHHGPRVLLCNSCSGRHRLTTASGAAYVLDFDGRTVQRSPNSAAAVAELADPSVVLRRDGEVVTFVELAEPLRLGNGALLVLSGVAEDPGVYTVRSTTAVVKVVSLPAEPQGS